MVLQIGHCGKWIRNTLKVLKCGAGEGWRRSICQIVCEMKKARKEGTFFILENKGRLTKLVTSA
jgi:hypothetical protein